MENELYHFGIKGMKWGVRRFQNPDGTLTPAGKERYGSSYNTIGEVRDVRRSERRMNRALRTGKTRNLTDSELEKVSKRINAELNYKRMMEQLNPKKQSRAKRIVAEISENAAKDIGRRVFTAIGNKIFDKPDTTTSEYSTKDLDKLTDKQLQDFQKRQQAKSSILGTQQKIDNMREKASKEDKEREEKVDSWFKSKTSGMGDSYDKASGSSEESKTSAKNKTKDYWDVPVSDVYDSVDEYYKSRRNLFEISR